MTTVSPARRRSADLDVYAVIALGGAAGAAARYGLAVLLPHTGAGVPWGTWVANVAGCLAIGVLMGVIDLAGTPHRLLRPFVGVGLLGGMTTFATYTTEVGHLVATGAVATGLAYLAGTLLTALGAVAAGLAAVRGLTRRPRRGTPRALDSDVPGGDDASR